MLRSVGSRVANIRGMLKLKGSPSREHGAISQKKLKQLQTLLESFRSDDRAGVEPKQHERQRGVQEHQERLPPETPYTEVEAGKESSQAIMLRWEIFPPGTVDEVVGFFSKGMKSNRGRHDGILRERVEAFMALKPEAYIRGVDRFNRYIGAKVSDHLVVFENWRYGNALYILYENWKEISKQSRLDLLQDTNAHFDRIIHGPGWRERLEETIRQKRLQRTSNGI